jgi:hypothetical protein
MVTGTLFFVYVWRFCVFCPPEQITYFVPTDGSCKTKYNLIYLNYNTETGNINTFTVAYQSVYCAYLNTKEKLRQALVVVNIFEHLTYIILNDVYLNLFYSESDHLTFLQKIFSKHPRSVIYLLNRDVYSTFPNYRSINKYLGEINLFKPSNC